MISTKVDRIDEKVDRFIESNLKMKSGNADVDKEKMGSEVATCPPKPPVQNRQGHAPHATPTNWWDLAVSACGILFMLMCLYTLMVQCYLQM